LFRPEYWEIKWLRLRVYSESAFLDELNQKTTKVDRLVV
jgi:hypothetical protein